MKNSLSITAELPKRFEKIYRYDGLEIDNPDSYHHLRLAYIDRIRNVISIIRRECPTDASTAIGEFGCAQGNMSLMLAEDGYKVYAIDIDTTFIEYSKLKYEKGDVTWLNKDFDQSIAELQGKLDVAILGEIVEHCAYPEDIVQRICASVKPGGILIVTTPNGSRLFTDMPTFTRYRDRKGRAELEKRQFGPDGDHHLFLFTLGELDYLVSKECEVVEKGYLGSSVLFYKFGYHALRILPVPAAEKLIRVMASIPGLNRWTFNNVYMVMRKKVTVP